MKFLTPADARAARPNLDATAVMRVDEYGGLTGNTEFPEIHFVECQLINKFGNVCRKKHGDGHVVRRKDGVEVFVGGDCFQSHLAEVGGEIAKQYERDAAELKRAIDLADARRRFTEKLANAELAHAVNEIWQRANTLKEAQSRQRRIIGPKVLDRLTKIARSQSRSVPGEAKHIEMREDENQQPYPVAVWRPISFGTVSNPEAVDPTQLGLIEAALRSATAALKVSTPIEELDYKQLKRLLKAFEPIEGIPQRLEAMESALASFSTAANMRTISWFARDPEDADRIIHHVLAADNQPRQPQHIRAAKEEWLRAIQAENRGRQCRPL